MIQYLELREKSREYEIPISTIERDYAQNWILKYLSEIDMALKGGTGIKKIYINDYRFSDDLDFRKFFQAIVCQKEKILSMMTNHKVPFGLNSFSSFIISFILF